MASRGPARPLRGTWAVQAVINATDTWGAPNLPWYPGIDTFTGRQLHAAQYVSAAQFAGLHVVVAGGGISAVQLLEEISRVTTTPWVTRSTQYPHAGPLLADRWNEDLVADCWGDLLRMSGSLKFGEATASLIVGKWSAASRQNTLAAALKEWGRMRRTIHAALTCLTRSTAGRSPGSSTRANR